MNANAIHRLILWFFVLCIYLMLHHILYFTIFCFVFWFFRSFIHFPFKWWLQFCSVFPSLLPFLRFRFFFFDLLLWILLVECIRHIEAMKTIKYKAKTEFDRKIKVLLHPCIESCSENWHALHPLFCWSSFP